MLDKSKIIGNALGDKELWIEAHEIAVNKSLTLEIRLKALAFMNDLTGANDPVNEEELNQYVEFTK